jgi:hypothetical protein
VGDRVGEGEWLVLGDGDRDGLAERDGLCVGVGVGVRRELELVGVGAGVGAGVGWVDPVDADGGLTMMYRANTPTNSPISTMVDVRSRLTIAIMRRPRSRGRCRGRRRR